MQSIIKLNFADVNEYRKAVGRTLLEKLSINLSSSALKGLEIGPGQQSELIQKLIHAYHDGSGMVFIEPHQAAAERVQGLLPKAKVIGAKAELQVPLLPSSYFDFIYANFSLHWSEQLDRVLEGLYESLKPGGKLGLTITDQERSFWALVNQSFKSTFQGCDLFNASEAKSLSPQGWKESLVSSGFQVTEEIIFSGISSQAPSAEAALEGFKNAVGDKYLKLNGITKETAEKWILSELSRFANSEGKIEIPASGLSFVCTK